MLRLCLPLRTITGLAHCMNRTALNLAKSRRFLVKSLTGRDVLKHCSPLSCFGISDGLTAQPTGVHGKAIGSKTAKVTLISRIKVGSATLTKLTLRSEVIAA